MKNKNGFTLVELLAVIAILAILVIIALPNVMGMFRNAKKNSFETEVKNIYKVAQQTWMNDSMFDTSERIYSRCSDCTGKSLNLSGRTELDYYIRLNKSGKVVEYYASDGTYQYRYSDGDLDINDISGSEEVSKISNPTEILNISEVVKEINGNPEKGNYFDVNTKTYYETLNSLLSDSTSNHTIRVLNDSYETEVVTVPSTINGLKIDMNAKTIYVNNYNVEYTFINNGTVEFYNSQSAEGTYDAWNGMLNNGTITVSNNVYINCENDAIVNNGTVNLNGGRLMGREATGLENYGTLNMTSGYIGGYVRAFENTNIAHVSGGEINALTAVVNTESGQITIDNGTLLNGMQVGISNSGVATLNGVTIKTIYVYGDKGIFNSGTMNVYDTSIEVGTGGQGRTAYGMYNRNTGTLNFYSGSVNVRPGGYQTYGLYNEGTATITDGTIKSDSNYVGQLHGTGLYSAGTTTVLNGNISGSQYGAQIAANKTLTLGTTGSVNDSPIVIEGYGTNGVGVAADANSVFNFYSGTLKGKRNSMTGTITSKPEGAQVETTTENGYQITTLLYK